MTALGYIKRQAADTYKAQRRGGKGIIGMTTRDEDYTETMFACSSHDYVMFFTSFGKVYRLKCYEIPEGARTAKGMNIVNLLPIEKEEKVTAMIRVSDYEGEQYLCMVTAHGVIKRTRLSAYANVRKNGLIAVDLDEGDRLVSVHITDGSSTLLVATKNGFAIRFDENDARVVGRLARGVRAISLTEGDTVIGMDLCDSEHMLLTVTETGFGRLSAIDEYRLQSRGGKGIINYHTETYGKVAGVRMVTGDEDLILIADNGVMIRMRVNEIRQCSRTSKGVLVMRFADDNTRIVSMVCVPHEEPVAPDAAEAPADGESVTPEVSEMSEGVDAPTADETAE